MNLSLSLKRMAGLIACAFLFHVPADAQVSSFVQTYSRYESRKAEGKNVNSYLSYYAQYGVAFTAADYTHTFIGTDANGEPVGEQSIYNHYDLKGISIGAGMYFPIADISDNSKIAFNLLIVFNVFNYEPGRITTSPYSTYDYSIQSFQVGVPLTLDYKYGGEANFDKTEKVSFTLGAGLSPMMNATGIGPMSNLKFNIRPYVHAELGIFAGIEWRIHFAYYAGQSKLLDLNSSAAFMDAMPDNSRITMNSSSLYTVGIAIMPFSFDWKKGW